MQRKYAFRWSGVWLKQPQMLTYFAPFYWGLRKLGREGVNVTIPDEEVASFTSKVVVICGTCDLPAKCLVCITVQYNVF